MSTIFAFLVIIILCLTVLYFQIKKYNNYMIYNGNTFDYVIVINKNPMFVTLAYTDKEPKKMLTVLFIVKTQLDI